MRMRFTFACVIALAVTVACTTFTPAPEVESDAGPPDGGPPDLDALPPPDAPRPFDADEAGDCIDEVIAGNAVETGTAPNDVGAGSIDAYGFFVVRTETLHCVRARFFEDLPPTRTVAAGIYTDETGSPRHLRATAQFLAIRAGWNIARLNPPIDVMVGSQIWIAVATTEPFQFRSRSGGCAVGRRLAFANTSGTVPPLFPPTPTRTDSCDGLLYVTP